MEAYLRIAEKVLKNGIEKKDRTGTGTLSVPGMMFEHDMEKGFPLITTKTVPLRLIASELEFFIKGITDKQWLQDRNNHIWDEWCSPKKVKYGHDPETKKKMADERELGPIYGWQWRNFGSKYNSFKDTPDEPGIDQLKMIVDTLKADPSNRRMICTAWNPIDLPEMALPPCHYLFQVIVAGKRLNLLWNQRSVDVALGLPFNIASYGLLLHLLSKETGLEEGKLVGFLGDTHIYLNHIEGIKEQLTRKPLALPRIYTENFTSIFEWKYSDSIVEGYEHHPRIRFEIAV